MRKVHNYRKVPNRPANREPGFGEPSPGAEDAGESRFSAFQGRKRPKRDVPAPPGTLLLCSPVLARFRAKNADNATPPPFPGTPAVLPGSPLRWGGKRGEVAF